MRNLTGVSAAGGLVSALAWTAALFGLTGAAIGFIAGYVFGAAFVGGL